MDGPKGPFEAVFVDSQYSEMEMYTATAIPTRAANHVEDWKITQVAMQRPKYVKYRVIVT